MDYKALLTELLAALKVTKKKFAEGLGLSQGNVSDWFNRPGYRPSIDALKRISETYNVNLNWLVTGQGQMFNDVPARASDRKPRILANRDMVLIPVAADIAAGSGIEAFDVEPSEQLVLHRALLTLPGPYYAFKVDGESMEPHIQTGDYAVVTAAWHDLDIQSRICAVRTIDGLTLKRFYVEPAHCALLIPLNPNFPVTKYAPGDPDYTIVGLLMLVIRKYV